MILICLKWPYYKGGVPNNAILGMHHGFLSSVLSKSVRSGKTRQVELESIWEHMETPESFSQYQK